MTTMSILVKNRIWILNFYILKALRPLNVGSIGFYFWDGNVIMLDAIIELHAMDETLFNDFLIGK